MPIKVESAKAWGFPGDNGKVSAYTFVNPSPDIEELSRVRIVRESDWRKLMAVVRAAEVQVVEAPDNWTCTRLRVAVEKLRGKKS